MTRSIISLMTDWMAAFTCFDLGIGLFPMEVYGFRQMKTDS